MPQPETNPGRDFILDDFLPYQLAALSERVSGEFSACYRERFGISVPEWRVVANLSQADGPVSVREINRQVGMEKSKVSRAAARLEERGYVVKRSNPADRRLIELSLSDAGRQMVRELTPLAAEFERRLLDRLGPGKDAFRAALETLLTK